MACFVWVKRMTKGGMKQVWLPNVVKALNFSIFQIYLYTKIWQNMKEERIAEQPAAGVEQRSDYEIERGKPLPNRIHGALQSKINSLLGNGYDDRFQFPNELSLATRIWCKRRKVTAHWRTVTYNPC